MIKATGLTTDGESVVLLGLSRENTNRLLTGQPISVKVHEMDPRLPELTVLLIGGETEDSITAEMRAHFGDRLR